MGFGEFDCLNYLFAVVSRDWSFSSPLAGSFPFVVYVIIWGLNYICLGAVFFSFYGDWCLIIGMWLMGIVG